MNASEEFSLENRLGLAPTIEDFIVLTSCGLLHGILDSTDLDKTNPILDDILSYFPIPAYMYYSSIFGPVRKRDFLENRFNRLKHAEHVPWSKPEKGKITQLLRL